MSNFKTPPNFQSLTGSRFGRLLVIDRAENSAKSPNGTQSVRWRCVCDCGKETIVRALNLKKGTTRSCGCYQKERLLVQNRTHGHTVGAKSRVYRAWREIISRCTNKNVKCYPRYGGSGVTVCKEWMESFDAFLAYMGDPATDDLTIDRIDGTKGYEPGNCRWATKLVQARNKKNVVLTSASAEQLRLRRAQGVSFKEIAAEFGVSASTAFNVAKGKTWA